MQLNQIADDLVDGQEGGDEVIDQHDDQPEQRGGDDTVGAAVLEQGDDQAGRANSKHRTHHNQQHHAEHTHDVLHEAAQIDAGDLGDGGTVVALAHHTGEIVVDAASEDGAEGDPQEHDGAPQSTLQSAEDGTEARNVQQLDHEQLPLGQDHIVHAVVDLYGRRFTVVGAEGVLHDLAVQEVAADQQSKTDQKTNHIVSSLHNDTKGFPGCSPGAARGNSRSACKDNYVTPQSVANFSKQFSAVSSGVYKYFDTTKNVESDDGKIQKVHLRGYEPI